MKALLDEARSDKLCALYVLAVTTGMRQGEILGLQWKDLDLNTATLKVNRSVYNGVVSPPKTTAGRRTTSIQTGGSSTQSSRYAAGAAVYIRMGF